MSLYSTNLPAGAQFDDNAPWEPSHVERSIHEVESFVPSREPIVTSSPENLRWRQRLADAIKKEVK